RPPAPPAPPRLPPLPNPDPPPQALPALRVVPRLSALAGVQSARMAAARRLSSSVGLAAVAQPARAWKEQVRCAASAEAAHQDLMASTTARRRILSRSFNALGVGATRADCLWGTQGPATA